MSFQIEPLVFFVGRLQSYEMTYTGSVTGFKVFQSSLTDGLSLNETSGAIYGSATLEGNSSVRIKGYTVDESIFRDIVVSIEVKRKKLNYQ